MHLWPSLRIRDSFKRSYLDKLELNLHRMKLSKASQPTAPLLSDSSKSGVTADAGNQSESTKPVGLLVFFHDIFLLLSCCCCCFCCGACGDEERNTPFH